MPQMYSVAGKKIFIGNSTVSDQDDDFIESDFSGQSWTEIKGWVTMGAVGGEAALVTSEQINSGYTKKGKGVKNSGSMANTFDILEGDAGQADLIAAIASSANFAFKIEFPLRAGQATPTMRLLVGLAMGFNESGGGPNDPDRFESTIELQNNVVRVAAT